MDGRMGHKPSVPGAPRRRRVEQELLIARDLILDEPTVAAVYVVSGRRPTWQGMARLRASARGVRVHVESGGCVVLRRPEPGAVAAPAGVAMGARLAALRDRAVAAVEGWTGRHVWFPSLAEGTR